MAGFVVLLSLNSNSFKSLLILIVMTGLPDFWTSGLLDFRTSGLPDFWTSGLPDFRTSGLLDFRTSGLPDFYIYLIFSVTMVRAARMMVVIQNLTVIFDSLNWRRGQWRKM
jgi:hypothetical protein